MFLNIKLSFGADFDILLEISADKRDICLKFHIMYSTNLFRTH